MKAAASYPGKVYPRQLKYQETRLNHECLSDPGIKARLAELMVTPLVLSPAEFGAYMTAETAKWTKVVKLANIKAE